MQEIGKFLVLAGLAVTVIGALIWLGLGNWIGKLPGDITIQKGNFGFYFPIVTCIVISVIFTVLLWLFRR
ncbi:MAG: DUF2905 domain-containing protein [Chthoniobacterales bacterium]